MVIQQAKPARWWFALVLSHALTVLALAGAPPSNDEVKSNVNVQVKASVSPTVVEGMPCIMKILVTNHTPKIQYPPKDTWFKLTKEERGRILGQNAMARLQIPAYLPFNNQPPPFSIEITDEKGVTKVEPIKPGLNAFYTADWEHIHVRLPDGGMASAHPNRFKRPTTMVKTDESAAFFIDLSPWLADLKPGTYSLTVRLYVDHRSELSWASPAEEFEVKSLDEKVRKFIQHTVPAESDKQDVQDRELDWLSPKIHAQALHNVLPPEVWMNVAFHVLLAEATAANTADDLTPELIESLPPRVRPIADVVRYELLLDVSDEAGAEQLRTRFADQHPELVWMMDRAAEGDGLIAHVRKLRDK